MSKQAHVASLAALDDFRAKLVVFLSKAGRVLDDVRQDVVSTRIWLQTDRQLHWKHELRKRGNKLAQAEQELLSARLSGHPGAIQDRRMAVHRARTSYEEAERGLQAVKRWLQRYETDVEAQLKAVNQLRRLLTLDMAKGAQFLETAAARLAEYAELQAGPARPASGSTATSATTPVRGSQETAPAQPREEER